MKSLFIILIIYITGSRANIFNKKDSTHNYGQQMSRCLTENGLNESHLKYVYGLGKENFELPQDISEDAIACMLACMYNFTITMRETQKTLDETILDVINLDDMFSDENKRKVLREVLESCKKEAEGNNCKLLQCLKVTRDPFDKVITAGRHNYRYSRRDE